MLPVLSCSSYSSASTSGARSPTTPDTRTGTLKTNGICRTERIETGMPSPLSAANRSGVNSSSASTVPSSIARREESDRRLVTVGYIGVLACWSFGELKHETASIQ